MAIFQLYFAEVYIVLWSMKTFSLMSFMQSELVNSKHSLPWQEFIDVVLGYSSASGIKLLTIES